MNLKEFTAQVEKGQKLIICNNKIYDIAKLFDRHPGGNLAISHMIGKDATDQITTFHPIRIRKYYLSQYYVGELSETNKTSSSLSSAFRRLEEEICEQGLLKVEGVFITRIAIRLIFLFMTAICLVLNDMPFMASFVLGLFWHQAAFLAHDAGHNGITQNRETDHLIGIVLGNFMGGISIQWWKDSHNIHHLMTNHPEHDPDIQHLPFFAINEIFFNNIYSSFHNRTLVFDKYAAFFIKIQNYLYYPVMFFGRFNLYAESFKHYNSHAKEIPLFHLEIIGMIFFWSWYLYLLSFVPTWYQKVSFILISHGITLLLHVQITLSHFAMSSEKMMDDEEFIKHQLRTSLDIDCPRWLDWLNGGLQFQAIHHLFPRIPRSSLRLVRSKVIDFCKFNGLEYKSISFVEANLMVLSNLKDVALKVKT